MAERRRTNSHVVIGLLDRISSGLNVSNSRAGQLVTVFSVSYAIFAPLCGWAFSQFDRKSTIQIASCVFIVGNLVCDLASDATDRFRRRRVLIGAIGVQTVLLPTIVLVRDFPLVAISTSLAWGVTSNM